MAAPKNHVPGPSSPPPLLRGRIAIHEKGFGFVTGPDASAFVAPPMLNGWLLDDVVDAVVEGSDRLSATSLQLVSRPRSVLVGEVRKVGNRAFIRPDRGVSNTDWALEGADTCAEGDIVRATIVGGIARFEASIPSKERPIAGLLERHRLKGEIDSALEKAAAEAPAIDDLIVAQGSARRDLRGTMFVTIDGASTKDIDDAVTCLPPDDDGALRVIVAIADVAELVHEDSALDVDARSRGVTIYLPDRVFPMLPRSLSEQALSLVEGSDRLALTCEMRIDVDGAVVAVDVHESIVCSQARLTYEDVAAFLDDGESDRVKPAVHHTLRLLKAAAARLGVGRGARGGVTSDRTEVSVRVTPEGDAVDVVDVESTSAHLMIERLMVAANEAVATWCERRGIAVLYRVHEAPTRERTEALIDALENLGIVAGFSRLRPLSPLGLAALDSQISHTSVEGDARLLMRRLLGPARYDPTPGPHFGLAAPLYLHFTSPIRRYADLVVHRRVKNYLRGDRRGTADGLVSLAAHIDDVGRRAQRCGTDRERALAVSVLKSRIGDVFHGRVVAHKPFGALVQVVGLTAALPGAWPALGTTVAVTLSSVDVEQGRIGVALDTSIRTLGE